MDPGCCSLKKIVIPVQGDVKPGHVFYGGKRFSDLYSGKGSLEGLGFRFGGEDDPVLGLVHIPQAHDLASDLARVFNPPEIPNEEIQKANRQNEILNRGI